jgi:RNA polymerase sigma-70 factor, ECF subfamily
MTTQFEAHRPRLHAVAHRMLGTLSDADDAVQDAWLRVSTADGAAIDNIGGWLTTVVARVCLNTLRARRARPELTWQAPLPDPLLTPAPASPDAQLLLADSVGLALLVVLDELSPAERLAFVLHDVFEVPFEDIAPVVERSAAATRQLASRARRRIRNAGARPHGVDAFRQRAVVDAFFAAARGGDFEALLAVLDDNVVLRADLESNRGRRSSVFMGAAEVARQARLGAIRDSVLHPVLVDGSPGVVVTVRGRPFAVLGFVVSGSRIVEMLAIAGEDRVRRIAASVLAGVAAAPTR